MTIVISSIIVTSIVIAVGVTVARLRRAGAEMGIRAFLKRLLQGSGYRNIGPAVLSRQLQQNSSEPLLIDLRETPRYHRGHIEGALSRPFDDFLRDVAFEEDYIADRWYCRRCLAFP
jgi:hypothetical protein